MSRPTTTRSHIRARMPRKGGNSFYRDKRDYGRFAVTLYRESITDKDVDYATAKTKRFRASGWPTCQRCLDIQDEIEDAIIAEHPDAFSQESR